MVVHLKLYSYNSGPIASNFELAVPYINVLVGPFPKSITTHDWAQTFDLGIPSDPENQNRFCLGRISAIILFSKINILVLLK